MNYGTTDYQPPPKRIGPYKIVAVSDPPEPDGWQGSLRVALGRVLDDDQRVVSAVWYVRPDGTCVHGLYDLDPHEAEIIYAERVEGEGHRSARYAVANRKRGGD